MLKQIESDKKVLAHERSQLKKGLADVDALRTSLQQKHVAHTQHTQQLQEHFNRRHKQLEDEPTARLQMVMDRERRLEEKTKALNKQIRVIKILKTNY